MPGIPQTLPPKLIIQHKDMTAQVIKLEPDGVQKALDGLTVMDRKDIRQVCLVLEE